MDGPQLEQRIAEIVHKFFDHRARVGYQLRSYSRNGPWVVGEDVNQQLFCASAFKAFVLVTCLRRWENGEVDLDQKLTITDAVRSTGGETSWAHLPSGTVKTLRQALDAMIGTSDNTATDMVLRTICSSCVRELLADHGFPSVVIPDSTRRFTLQAFGIEPWQPDPGWEEFQKLIIKGQVKRSPFEISQRMAAPPNAFVDLYFDLGADQYLKTTAAKDILWAILAQSNPSMTLRPLLPGAFGIWSKGGNLDLQPYHVASLAGRLQFGRRDVPVARWLNFAFIADYDQETSYKDFFDQFVAMSVEVLNLVIDNLDA